MFLKVVCPGDSIYSRALSREPPEYRVPLCWGLSGFLKGGGVAVSTPSAVSSTGNIGMIWYALG